MAGSNLIVTPYEGLRVVPGGSVGSVRVIGSDAGEVWPAEIES